MGSVEESEIGAVYMTVHQSVPIKTCLEEMDHPQSPTPIQVDNTMSARFANKTIKQKRSKDIDMRFYWLQDRCNQGQFVIYWAPGSDSLADYHTKNLQPSHRIEMKSTILHCAHSAESLINCLLRGYVNTANIIAPKDSQ